MIVARGLGQDTDYRSTMVGYGYARNAVGGGGGPSTPLPYGFDKTDRVYRDDILAMPRAAERIVR